MLITMGIGHGLAYVHLCPDKDRFVVMLASSIRLCYFSLLKLLNSFQFAGRWLSTAICHLIWLYSRKYVTPLAAMAEQRSQRLGAKPHQANYSTPYDRNKSMTHDIYIYIHICICHL
jgi:hypothetical protein